MSKANETEEYMQNQAQIDCIKKVLIEHVDVPPKLLDWLIQSVERNALISYKMNKNV